MQYKHLDFSIKSEDILEDGQIRGYASVFGNEDLGGDIITRGAFSVTLKNIPINRVKMLWQHKPDSPIGVWKSGVEDEKGLVVEGQIAIKTKNGNDAYELLKIGAINGLSIGYRVVDSVDVKGKTLIKSVELLEISLVTFPMNQQATISRIKSTSDALVLESFQKLRDFLRGSNNE